MDSAIHNRYGGDTFQWKVSAEARKGYGRAGKDGGRWGDTYQRYVSWCQKRADTYVTYVSWYGGGGWGTLSEGGGIQNTGENGGAKSGKTRGNVRSVNCEAVKRRSNVLC